MSFFSSLFSVEVTEANGKISVKNVPTQVMEIDIKKLYNTSRIFNNMFSYMSRRSFTIDSFFALELVFIIEDLTKYRKVGTNMRVLSAIKKGLKENTWLKRIDLPAVGRLDFDKLKELTMTPLDFQLQFMKKYSTVNETYGLNGLLLAAAPGSGKTFTTLAIGHCLGSETIIVVCPKAAVDNVWEETVGRIFRTKQSCWTYMSGKPYRGERVAVFHYEALEKALNMVAELKRHRPMVILDESHNLNELKSLRTQRFNELCTRLGTKDVIYASGTAVKATSMETIPLFKSIDPLFTDEVMERFKRMFQGDVSKATSILANRLNAASFKVEKSALDLKAPIFKEIKVTIPNGNDYTLLTIAAEMAAYIKERRIYFSARRQDDQEFFDQCMDSTLKILTNPKLPRKVIQVALAERAEYLRSVKLIQNAERSGRFDAVVQQMTFCTRYETQVIIPNLPNKETKDKFKDVKSIIKYTSLKIRGECLGRVLGRKRIDAHVDMAKHINYSDILDSTMKKTVVFTSFVEVVDTATAILKEQGRMPLVVYGKMDTPLMSVVNTFATNPDANPLIATFASLSTAVPLVMADTLLMINLPFRTYVLEQAVSRAHRIGQDSQVMVFTTVLDTGSEPNISSRNVDILKWSQEQVEKILQIESPFKIGEDGEDSIAVEQYCPEWQSEQDVIGLRSSNVATEEIAVPPTPVVDKPLWHAW